MNAIDLTTLAAVRGYLGLVPSNGGAPVVQTIVLLPITSGLTTVAPLNMANISVGSVLLIDFGALAEYVQVTAIPDSLHFTAKFAFSHGDNTPVIDQTDAILSGMITGVSQYWLTRTGRDSLNGSASYSEYYDGSGSRRQFLRNSPITSVSLLQMSAGFGGTVSIPQSTSLGAPGWVIGQGGKYLGLIGYPQGTWTGSYGPTWPTVNAFVEGIQNIFVQYTAGYLATPADISDKVTQQVSINYKRTAWIDQASQVLNENGTVSYRNWEVPPEVERVIQAYIRRAIV